MAVHLTASGDEALDFPIPSIKAPSVSLAVLKSGSMFQQLRFLIKSIIKSKEPLLQADSWQQSDRLTLEKANDFQASVTKLPLLVKWQTYQNTTIRGRLRVLG